MNDTRDDPLEVRASTDADGAGILTVVGEIDIQTAPTIDAALRSLMSQPTRTVTIDLGEVGFIDSTGLRVLIQAHKDLEASGGKLRFSRVSEAARRLFEVTGMDTVFTLS